MAPPWQEVLVDSTTLLSELDLDSPANAEVDVTWLVFVSRMRVVRINTPRFRSSLPPAGKPSESSCPDAPTNFRALTFPFEEFFLTFMLGFVNSCLEIIVEWKLVCTISLAEACNNYNAI